MDNELAPEFIYDQGLYYPAAGNYYGYVCTGMEPPTEWEEHHKFFGLDGQDLQFSGLQTENLPCVYYTPSYDYAQSPYNPFNPYIPGAIVGTDGPYMGTQQCFTNPPYLQTVSPPGYAPFLSQSGSDPLLSVSSDPLLFSNGAVKYAPSLSSMSVTTTPLKVAFENLSLEPSYSSQHIQLAGRLSEGAAVNSAPRKKFLPYGDLANANGPQISQRTEHSSSTGVPSVRGPLKVTMPASNGYTNSGSNIHGWAPDERMRPRIPYSGIPNRILGEQNMGPRTNKPRTPLASPIVLKAYTTKAGTVNMDGNIIIHADQYNRDEFPVDYPDAKFFVIKSYSEDDVHKSIKYNVWSSTSSGNKKLDIAYEEAQISSVGKPRKCPVFLFFSVNASGHFCGVAEMIGPVDFNKDMDFWLQDKWTGSFPVKWHIIKDVPNANFRHIILVNNEFRPVTSSRDTQEVPYPPGMSMLTIFKNCPLSTSILDDFMFYEERQRIMQEEKSLFLGRKSYVATVSSATSVPSRPGVTISHPSKADERLSNGTVVQPCVASGKENVKADHPLESDGRKKISNTGDLDVKADDKQKADESNSPSGRGEQLNSPVNQPSKSDGMSGDASGLAESNARQINHTAKQSMETKRNQVKNLSTPKGTDVLAPSNVHSMSRDSRVDLEDKKKGMPESAAGSNDHNSSRGIGSVSASAKIDETDVLTVGSVQIEITDSNRCISGTLTIGSIPVNAKEPKS